MQDLGEFASLARGGDAQMWSRRVAQRAPREQRTQLLVTEFGSCEVSQLPAFERGDREAVLEQ